MTTQTSGFSWLSVPLWQRGLSITVHGMVRGAGTVRHE